MYWKRVDRLYIPSHTDTIPGLLKSDFRRSDCSLTEVYFAASQQILGTSGIQFFVGDSDWDYWTRRNYRKRPAHIKKMSHEGPLCITFFLTHDKMVATAMKGVKVTN